jgi:hypothetical protein
LTIQARKWIELFTSLGGACDGYWKSNVTPYMHAMAYHAPSFMRKHSLIHEKKMQSEQHLSRKGHFATGKRALFVFSENLGGLGPLGTPVPTPQQ